MSWIQRLKSLKMQSMRLGRFRCPGCGPSLIARYGDDETQVRCVRCSGTPIHLSLMACLLRDGGDLAARDAYELSGAGALLRFLRRRCHSVVASEFFEDVPPGSMVGGTRCEDVQQLSFADASFDLCTSTEVFEHVPDDLAGFRELHRVLRPGGLCAFTVPMTDDPVTCERARLTADGIDYLLPPAYHGDRLQGPGRVLVYRDYGTDICDRLLQNGFTRAWLCQPPLTFSGHFRKVILATR